MQTKPVLLILKLNYTLTIAKWSSLLLKNKPIGVIYWVDIYYYLKTKHFLLNQAGEVLFLAPISDKN